MFLHITESELEEDRDDRDESSYSRSPTPPTQSALVDVPKSIYISSSDIMIAHDLLSRIEAPQTVEPTEISPVVILSGILKEEQELLSVAEVVAPSAIEYAADDSAVI